MCNCNSGCGSCSWIIILILILCCCGGCGNNCGCNNNCGCCNQPYWFPLVIKETGGAVYNGAPCSFGARENSPLYSSYLLNGDADD